jgi:hypothetical protein
MAGKLFFANSCDKGFHISNITWIKFVAAGQPFKPDDGTG